MTNSRRGLTMLIGLAILFAASVSSVEALSGSGIPDALYLDIETAPGYLWMNGCGEMGATKSLSLMLDLDLDLSMKAEVQAALGITRTAVPAQTPSTSDAHTGHHPGQGIQAVNEVQNISSEIERELAGLSLVLTGISNSLYWGK